jgi:hypothetical protein
MNTIKMLAVLFVVLISTLIATLIFVFFKYEGAHWSIGFWTYPIVLWIIKYKPKTKE